MGGMAVTTRAFPWYLGGIASWFSSFGMQTIVFPWLVTVVLHEPAARVGIAQMSLMAPAAAKVGPRGDLSRAEYLERMEKASIVNTLDNLLTFPRLRKLIESGAVTLHGAYFGVATGELSVLDRTTGEFVPVR